MSRLEKQQSFKLTYRRVFFVCLASYCYSSWLSLVLAKWLPFNQAENVYFAVFIALIFFILYIILATAIISRLWFWLLNSFGIFLLGSYWLLMSWGIA
ncbi:hypothetical protein F2A31_08330 [Acinetobacter suaedae]|uniref:Iron transporter n=1 Tax=Acinetobacter suaedae TaxID=2609668 RepID=A0A5P1US14_9GAMM|nr:hypothetical protein [Acinetobacter sp. C16S1]QER39719.1 hypothetical protein F2A31_08330 [Acinetobacter sp. C16S1]